MISQNYSKTHSQLKKKCSSCSKTTTRENDYLPCPLKSHDVEIIRESKTAKDTYNCKKVYLLFKQSICDELSLRCWLHPQKQKLVHV